MVERPSEEKYMKESRERVDTYKRSTYRKIEKKEEGFLVKLRI
jgi:hypothetical protein